MPLKNASKRKRLFFSDRLSEIFEFSRFYYQIPVILPIYNVFPNSPEHKDRFEHAIDIAIPNPSETETVIYAPQSGIVRSGILSNNRWGPGEENKIFLNWINIEVGKNEFYELAHIAPIPGKTLRVGDKVVAGEPILLAALNGRITKTNNEPDSHVHMLVGKWLNWERSSFISLKIRWYKYYPFINK